MKCWIGLAASFSPAAKARRVTNAPALSLAEIPVEPEFSKPKTKSRFIFTCAALLLFG